MDTAGRQTPLRQHLDKASGGEIAGKLTVRGPEKHRACTYRCTRREGFYTNFHHFRHGAGTPWMKRGDEYLALKEDIRQRLLEELFQHVPQLRSAGLDGSAHTAELRDIRQT